MVGQIFYTYLRGLVNALSDVVDNLVNLAAVVGLGAFLMVGDVADASGNDADDSPQAVGHNILAIAAIAAEFGLNLLG